MALPIGRPTPTEALQEARQEDGHRPSRALGANVDRGEDWVVRHVFRMDMEERG